MSTKMTQYNTLNVNSQLHKLKSGIQNRIEVALIVPVVLMMRLIFHTNYY